VAGPFDGPALVVESGGSRHLIAMTAPSTGWVIAFDTSRKYFDHTDAFITITRPNPAFPNTPGEVQQKLDSTVDSHERLIVYARLTEFDQKPGPYRLAAGSAPPRRPDEQIKK
jgi:hypothetical protein